MTTKCSTNRSILLTVRIHKIENKTGRKEERNKNIAPHTKAPKRAKKEKATRRQTSMNKSSLLSDTCHPASDFPEEARQLTEENDQKA